MYIKNVKNNVIDTLLFLYILSLYLFTFRVGLNIISNIIALLLIMSIWIYILFYKKNILINKFIVIHSLFILICTISVLYSLNPNIAFVKVRTLILIFILMLSVINYIDSYKKIETLMLYFIISGLIASLYIILNSDFSDITRYGSQLGNVNIIGMILGLSAIFCYYFIYIKKRYIFIFLLLSFLVMIFLTGSRKSLLFIMLNLLIMTILNNKNNIKNISKSFVIIIILSLAGYYLVFYNSFLYQIIGKRIDNMMRFILGYGTSEGSIKERLYMIQTGIDMWKQRPFLGYGIDNYRVLYSNFYYGRDTYSHNNYIELLVGVGGIGIIIYYLTHIIVLIELLIFKSRNSSKSINYTFASIIISYMIIALTLVYYDSKHFSIIISISSILNRLKNTTNFEKNVNIK